MDPEDQGKQVYLRWKYTEYHQIILFIWNLELSRLKWLNKWKIE